MLHQEANSQSLKVPMCLIPTFVAKRFGEKMNFEDHASLELLGLSIFHPFDGVFPVSEIVARKRMQNNKCLYHHSE